MQEAKRGQAVHRVGRRPLSLRFHALMRRLDGAGSPQHLAARPFFPSPDARFGRNGSGYALLPNGAETDGNLSPRENERAVQPHPRRPALVQPSSWRTLASLRRAAVSECMRDGRLAGQVQCPTALGGARSENAPERHVGLIDAAPLWRRRQRFVPNRPNSLTCLVEHALWRARHRR
jgi:hypothetical protein